MKLQINSLEALERLIGGDSEIELDLRQNVVVAFSKKYLRDVANSETLKEVYKATSKELTEQFLHTVKTGYVNHTQLTPFASSELERLLSQKITDILPVLVNKVFEEKVVLKQLNDLVDRQSKFIADQLTETVISGRLKQMVDIEIKKRLNL